MVGRHKLKALVFSRRNAGEADRLITLFTREQGLLKVVAKGVRRIPSRRGGHLEPYTMVLALVSVTKAGNFIQAVETLHYYQELQADTVGAAVARNIALTITGLFDEGQVQSTLFDALAHAWQILPTINPTQQGLLEMALMIHALEEAGMSPDLNRCQVCQTVQPNEAVLLDAVAGGFRCLLCQGSFLDTEYSFPAYLLKVLRFMRVSPQRALQIALTPIEVSHLLTAVRRYMAHTTNQALFIDQSAYA